MDLLYAGFPLGFFVISLLTNRILNVSVLVEIDLY